MNNQGGRKMIKIRAFKAVRPKEKWVKEVAALPYDVMTDEEAKKMVANHPYSFLNIDKPEIHSSADSQPYIYASNLLNHMIEEGVFVQETKCLYLYELITPYGIQYGLACLVSTKDYEESRIKKHEQTRKDKEEDRIKHIEYCQAHTGPIFLVEDEVPHFEEYLEEYAKTHSPIYHFMDEECIVHRLYAIREKEEIDYLVSSFSKVNNLYIADGHHRAAAAVKVAEKLGDRLPEANDFLAVIFPKEELHILAYHRMIKDESGYSKDELFHKLAEVFKITQVSEMVYFPSKAHEIGMYYQKQWYHLIMKSDCFKNKSVSKSLDVAVLQDEILGPVFNIIDPRTDKKIEFIPGKPGIDLVKECQNRKMDIIFTVYPTSVDDMIAVAKAGEMIPPKSTWFEPKLRSGLLIHKF